MKILDIKGKTCPMTYVYTKLELEKMDSGDTLEVIVDFPPAVENIPVSCKRQELAELIGIEEIGQKQKIWKLILKKK